MMTEVHRVQHPLVARAALPHIARAFAASGFDGDADKAAAYLATHSMNPALGLWIAVDRRNGITGVLVCVLPTNPLIAIPEIVINANWGERQAGREMVAAAIEFVKAAGYDRLVVCNRTGRSDAAFERLYRTPGRVMRSLGSIWEFTECPSAISASTET